MRYLQFKPYVKIFLNEETKKATISRVWEDNFQGIEYEMNDLGIFILYKIEKQYEEKKLNEELILKFPLELEEAKDILDFLKDENYIEIIDSAFYQSSFLDENFGKIIPLWTPFETKLKNRYMIQEEIMKKKIGIIGAGTIGFGVISKLVTSGIKNFVIIDDDIVEKSNLTRQPLFSLNDIGQLKTNVVKSYINNRVADGNVVEVNKQVSEVNDLEAFNEVDLIINCADDKEISSIIESYIFDSKIPTFFGGGYIGHTGRIDPLIIPGITKCFSCNEQRLKREYDDIGKPLSTTYKESTISSMSDFVSSILSFEIIKFLAGSKENLLLNRFILVNFKDYSITEIKPNASFELDCSLCKNNTLSIL